MPAAWNASMRFGFTAAAPFQTRSVRMGVDRQHLSARRGRAADVIGQILIEQSLAVIGDHHAIDALYRLVDEFQKLRPQHRCQRERALAIHPHHLLMPRDHARLQNGVVARTAQHAGGIDSRLRQQAGEPAAAGIVAGDAEQRGLRAQAAQIARDIRRAARVEGLAGHVDDRHGRFRRDPRHAAPDEFVQHEVADDQHTQPCESRDPGCFSWHRAPSHGRAPRSRPALRPPACVPQPGAKALPTASTGRAGARTRRSYRRS